MHNTLKRRSTIAIAILGVMIGTVPAGADSSDCDDGHAPGVASVGANGAAACVTERRLGYSRPNR